jgi:hypothetical protein
MMDHYWELARERLLVRNTSSAESLVQMLHSFGVAMPADGLIT